MSKIISFLQAFTKKTIKATVDKLKAKDTAPSLAMMVLEDLSDSRAADLAAYDKQIIATMKSKAELSMQGGKILVALSELSKVSLLYA
jgi:cytochrome c553